MRESGRKDLAYPKSQVNAAKFYLLKFCGGMGGGGCAVVLGDAEFIIPIRVPKHLVFNKSLVLRNIEFLGVEVFSDGGASGFCDHTLGVRQSWWLAFSDNGILTADEIFRRGIEITGAPPHEIEVAANKLPQPVLPNNGGANPNWEQRIYMHIYWGNPLFVTANGLFANRSENVLEIVKHDYDIKL